MTRLVLIGGPPAVGKSTVLRHLERTVEGCACLDADDLRLDDPERWVREVISALRGQLEARVPLAFVSWVFANPGLVKRVLDGVDGLYDSLHVVYLVASPEALNERCRGEPERGDRSIEYGLQKLAEIQALAQPKLDTTGLTPEDVAARIVRATCGLPEPPRV